MDANRWLYLSNLIELLQDEVTAADNIVVTAQFVHDAMNDPDEDPIPLDCTVL